MVFHDPLDQVFVEHDPGGSAILQTALVEKLRHALADGDGPGAGFAGKGYKRERFAGFTGGKTAMGFEVG